ATPTRIASLAPSTRPEAFVPAIVNSPKATLVAAVDLMNVRRVTLAMAGMSSIGAGQRGETRPSIVMSGGHTSQRGATSGFGGGAGRFGGPLGERGRGEPADHHFVP